MKEKIKAILADIIYFLYRKKILKNRIQICPLIDTIMLLVNSECSLIRMGDGEIKLISGKSIPNQDIDPLLKEKLKTVLNCGEDNVMIALPNVFEDISMFIPQSRKFWKEHMLFLRRVYYRECSKDIIYYDAFFSRPYIMYKDRCRCENIFNQVRRIWEKRKLVFVEGDISHNGVENDLFDNAASIERIICPSENAFRVYHQIREECLKLPKDVLIAMSIGAAGKGLALELAQEDYRVIDIGSLDMEYDWFRQKAEKKCYVKKHYIKTVEENIKAGYEDYLKQIRVRII